MTWAKFSDTTDEDLGYLSDNAFRAFVAAVTWSRRRKLGGVLNKRELTMLRRNQRIRPASVCELLNGYQGEPPLWLAEADDGIRIRSYEKFNPLTSTERMRVFRERHSDASVTSHETPSRARTPATRLRAGTPVPDTRYPEPGKEQSKDCISNGPRHIGQLIAEAWA